MAELAFKNRLTGQGPSAQRSVSKSVLYAAHNLMPMEEYTLVKALERFIVPLKQGDIPGVGESPYYASATTCIRHPVLMLTPHLV